MGPLRHAIGRHGDVAGRGALPMQGSMRARGKTVVSGIVIAGGLVVLLIAFWPWPRITPPPSVDTTGALTRVTLNVDGITCPTCTYRVRKALGELPGVKTAEVSLEQGQVVVEYEEGKVTIEQMIEAVKQAGYSAKPIGAGGQGR